MTVKEEEQEQGGEEELEVFVPGRLCILGNIVLYLSIWSQTLIKVV